MNSFPAIVRAASSGPRRLSEAGSTQTLLGERSVPSRRSWLFVPANREDRIAKAFATSADAVLMDLEDACPEADKASARRLVADAAAANGGRRCFVRINSAQTRHALDDLEAVVVEGLAGVMLPKAETAAGIHAISWVLDQLEMRRGLERGSIELIPLVETAIGVCNMTEIARCHIERVRRLTFGAGDLTTDLGTAWTRDEGELSQVRTTIVTASRAGRLEPPIDTVWPGIADADGLALSLSRARSMGFGGKLLIHPSQVDTANSALSPTEEEISHARRVLEAAAAAQAEGMGAFQLDGRLMDHVSVVRARRTLTSIGEII